MSDLFLHNWNNNAIVFYWIPISNFHSDYDLNCIDVLFTDYSRAMIRHFGEINPPKFTYPLVESPTLTLLMFDSRALSWYPEVSTSYSLSETIMLSHQFLWNTTFFFCIFYVTLVFSVALYTLPLTTSFVSTTTFKNTTNYIHTSFVVLNRFLLTPLVIIFFITLLWVSPTISLWFGQITVSAFQRSLSLISVTSFALVLYTYGTTVVLNTKEVYDFFITLFNTFVWIFFLFYANNIFTIIFFIELLTGLTTLLFITSVHSSTYTFSTSSLSKSLYFDRMIPKATLDVLIFFFWMSLVSSLLLFIFLIFFYTHILTFEFYLIEVTINHLSSVSLIKYFFAATFATFILLMVIFLKCGLVPLHIWKPTVFKGMTLQAVFFYIVFYYFFLLLFFVYLLIVYCTDFICYNKISLSATIAVGIFTLVTILLESYHLKAFLAMSSILNTLLIFLGVLSLSITNISFML